MGGQSEHEGRHGHCREIAATMSVRAIAAVGANVTGAQTGRKDEKWR
jgi:hypothetical protein